MESFRVLEIKKNVFESNDAQAAALRADLKRDGLFLVNLMSSPGSGKTTTVVRTIEALKGELRLGVIEADIDSDVDARTVAKTGTRVVQLHSGGMCHLDADMTRQGLAELGHSSERRPVGGAADGFDLVILENIGNLICTAEFDTGAARNAMILSVPEGDDKPLKYPLMFSMADALLVNKIDAISCFDFDLAALEERVRHLNPKIKIIPISAKTGQGIEEWADWLRAEYKAWKEE